jgi:signal recognition particle subunit SEC65
MSLKYQELLAQARKSSAKMSGSDTGSSRLANLGRSSRGQSRFVDEDDDAKLGGIMGKRRSSKSDLEPKNDFMTMAFSKVQENNEYQMSLINKNNENRNEMDEDSVFEKQLNQSESSGNTKADRTNKDGRRFAGAAQFGEARLDDARKALGIDFTMDEFKNNPKLQKRVYGWHIKDIDKAINNLGEQGKNYDRNGLRSVAHLGGIEGMNKYVKSGGQYNPKDELGTYLSDYYAKFSSVKGNRNV